MHFVWYLENKKSYDIEMLSIDRPFLKENHAGNMCHKLVPDLVLILVNNPKNHCMQDILKIRYFERGLSKRLKKVNFIFSFKPCLF